MATTVNFRDDAPSVTEEQLSLVTLRAQQLLEAMYEEQDFEKKLEEAKVARRRLEEVDLPTAMADAKMKEFTLTSGQKISIKDIVVGSIAKERSDTVMEWLRDSDNDGIIKRTITVSIKFPKGEDEKADETLKKLQELELLQSLGVIPQDVDDVHYMTYNAWIRESYAIHNEEHNFGSESRDEDHCPFCKEETVKLLGIYIGKKAEVYDPNAPKKRSKK